MALHQDNFETFLSCFLLLRKMSFQDEEQQVYIDIPFMHFIDDDMSYRIEETARLAIFEAKLEASEEYTSGTKANRAVGLRHLVVKAHLVANARSKILVSLVRNALSYTDGSQSSRLSTDNVAFGTFSFRNVMVEDDLGELRSLARARSGHLYS